MSFFSFFKKPEVFRSKINGTISIGPSYGKKALFVGRVPQSGGEFVYMWDTIINTVAKSGLKSKSVLLLGVAGGTAVKSLQKAYPKSTILGIDIDPVIVHVAEKYFNLRGNKKLTIHIADAIKWVKNCKSNKNYDLIIVDLYLGSLNPDGARTKSFLVSLKNLLSPHGMIIYNCDYQQENREKYLQYKKTCEKEFKKVEEIFSYKLNRVLVLQN